MSGRGVEMGGGIENIRHRGLALTFFHFFFIQITANGIGITEQADEGVSLTVKEQPALSKTAFQIQIQSEHDGDILHGDSGILYRLFSGGAQSVQRQHGKNTTFVMELSRMHWHGDIFMV